MIYYFCVNTREDSTASLLAIKTNLLQRNLTDIEEAKAIKKLIDEFGLTQSEIAEKLEKSQGWVSNRLSLILDVSQKVQNALKNVAVSLVCLNKNSVPIPISLTLMLDLPNWLIFRNFHLN